MLRPLLLDSACTKLRALGATYDQMRESVLRVTSRSLREELLPRLRGRVFHVTCASNVDSILRIGSIQANPNGARQRAFPSSSHSLFRRRGCVCVFDYRTADDDQLKCSLDACAPDLPARNCDFKLAVFFLAAAVHNDLELATIADWSKGMVVPYVEAGYPGAIPLSAIDEMLLVLVDHVPGLFELAHMPRSGDNGGKS